MVSEPAQQAASSIRFEQAVGEPNYLPSGDETQDAGAQSYSGQPLISGFGYGQAQSQVQGQVDQRGLKAHSSPRATSSKVNSRSGQLDGTAGGAGVMTGHCNVGSCV